MNNEEINLTNDAYSLHRILKTDIQKDPNVEEDEIIFGCGCFWGAEKCFWKLPGVITTSVGYAGGEKNNPTYYEVCSGLTGHSEVVRVIWDKREIDISDLLKMFWECHDPTQKNRQGNDIGTQYRSAIFCSNEDDIKKANDSKKKFQNVLSKNKYSDITTEISLIKNYYLAEEYHQQYLAKNPNGYCGLGGTGCTLD